MLTLLLALAFSLFAVPGFVLGRRRPSVMSMIWTLALGMVLALVYAGQFGAGLGEPPIVELHVDYGHGTSIGEPWSQP